MSKKVKLGGSSDFADRELTVMAFGPYDNAFVLLGFNDGVLVGLNPTTLITKFVHRVSKSAITSITIDPLHSFLVGCSDGTLINLTLEQTSVRYVYMEFGSHQFATVELKAKKHKEAPLLQLKAANGLPGNDEYNVKDLEGLPKNFSPRKPSANIPM